MKDASIEVECLDGFSACVDLVCRVTGDQGQRERDDLSKDER